MPTQTLYEKLIRSPMKFSWADVFCNFHEKHTQQDSDYAMIAGTTLDNAQTENGMLQKWQRPWLYQRIFKISLIASGLLMAAILIHIVLFGYCANACLNLLYVLVPGSTLQIAIMIFFWEMNAPRNISFVQLIGYFFTGGVFSILLSLILFEFIPTTEAYIAPLAEEPGKFLISFFFLTRIKKKQGKLYGLNGLVIGAAVGAGFAVFEDAQYAYAIWGNSFVQLVKNYAGNEGVTATNIIEIFVDYTGSMYMDMDIFFSVLEVISLRWICSLSSHALYCAPYSCMAALYMENNAKLSEVLKRKNFWIAFAISFAAHALWNAFAGISIVFFLGIFVGETVILWLSALKGCRLSFAQLVSRVPVVTNTTQTAAPALTALKIQGIAGVHNGVNFRLSHNEVLIGSDAGCNLSYPISTPNISQKHCKLLIQNGGLYLADLGSIAGTYLNGQRMPPMRGILLKQGDVFWLGSENEKFTVV